MLYMVECGFSNPAREQDWNDYYSRRKLDEVLRVPGFRTSQRFKSIAPRPANYIAVHSVDNMAVMTGSDYKGGGGGSFDASFQPCITNWRRSFYDGIERAPAVPLDEYIAVCDAPEEVRDASIRFVWLRSAAGNAVNEPPRGIARINRGELDSIAARHWPHIAVFAPIMLQRQELQGKY